MNTNFDLKVTSILEIHCLYKVADLHSEVSNSHRVMSVQKPGINFLLSGLEAATGHVGLSDSLDLLQPKLITQLIECIINLIQELQELIARVAVHDIIEVVDVDKYHRDFALLIREVFLAASDFVSHKRWHQDIQDALELQEVSYLAVAIDELGLFFQLLDVNIAGPDDGGEDSDEC